ncbi:MAG: hypothetical protein P4M00_14725 [Azospirillaceae bacterium]|nr:hypothetical protein [Azospirillaceae bacterium]
MPETAPGVTTLAPATIGWTGYYVGYSSAYAGGVCVILTDNSSFCSSDAQYWPIFTTAAATGTIFLHSSDGVNIDQVAVSH